MANDNPYLKIVTDTFGDDGDSDLRQSLIEGMKVNPDMAAKALPYAQEKKIPLDMAQRNLPELEADKRFQEIDFTRIRKESPMLGDFLRDRENAQLAHDDMPFLEKVHKTVTDVPKAFNEGQSDLVLGKLRDKQLRGVASPEEVAQADALSNRERPEQLGTGGFFSNVVTGVAGQVPILTEVGKQSLAFGMGAAGLTALAGQAGPQIAVPEEAVTVPVAFTVGATVGAFNASRQIESGLAYDEFLKFKDANGNSLDPNVARGAATIVGLANGALELVPLKKLVNTFPGADKLTQYFTKDGIKAALQYPGVKDALLNIGRRYGELVIAEGVTEFSQEAVTMYVGELAKVIQGGEFESPTGTEQLNRMAEAGKMGMTVAIGLGSPGTVINTGRVIAARNKQPDPQVVTQYLKNARETLADPNAKLPTRSLAKTRDYLNQITGNADIYIDGEAVQTFYQGLSPEDQAAINQALPDFTMRLSEAVDSKGDMVINRADYFTYIQPKDTKTFLDENARFMPEHFSAADVAEYDRFMAEVYDLAQDITGSEEGEIVQNNFYNQLLQRFGDRIQPSGKNDVAKLLSENPRAFYETMLENEGPQGKAILDRLIRDLQIVRPTPQSVGASLRRSDFDLMIDRVRNQKEAKGKRKGKTGAQDMFGQTKARKKSAIPSGPKPVMDMLAGAGRIKTGSAAAKRLAEMDITPKRYPKLFAKDGAIADLGAVSLEEARSALAGIIDPQPDTQTDPYYVDAEWIADQLNNEDFGTGALNEDQRAAEQEQAYLDDLAQAIEQAGIDLETASNTEIKVALERALAEQRAVEEGGGEVFNQWTETGYQRVMPRDLFNEAKVLTMHLKLVDDYNNGRLPKGFELSVNEGLKVGLTESGELYLDGVSATFNGEPVRLEVTYNAGKENKFPLHATAEDIGAWSVAVYTESGTLDEEFTQFFGMETAVPSEKIELSGTWQNAKTFMNQLGVVGLWDVDRMLPEDFTFDLRHPSLGFQLKDSAGKISSPNLDATIGGKKVQFFMDIKDNVLRFKHGKQTGPVLSGSRAMSDEFKTFLEQNSDPDKAPDRSSQFLQSGDQGARGSIRFTPSGQAIMTLFEKEDLSTVLHELGHLYWRTMTELAALPSASERIKKDVDTMRAWVGAKPLAEAAEPLTVEQEEKIADGFLAYLREGKAPSVELQGAFSRFKGWMVRLYRGLRDTLPSINKDVREVFDRMLATDDAIAALAREPVFQVDQAITSLLTKSEAARMQTKMDRAVEEAKARLYKKALRQSEQRNTQIYREARGKLLEEVTAGVNDERVYRAMDAIKEAGGLSRKALIKGWGKEILPYLSGHGGLVAKSGGADPSTIAGLIGYTNSRDMIGDLMNAPKKKDRINQLVDEEMLARYGDMLNDGSIEAEALEQMHSELRAEVLEMEVEILAGLAGIPAPTKEGIRAKAIQIMAETKVKDILPNRRLRAENKAYYDYGKALGKKDYVAAARAKAQQLLNHHLYQMSVQARRDIDKKMEAWRRLLNKSDEKIGRNRSVSKRDDGTFSAGPDLDYVYAARAVLAKYGIGRSDYDFEGFFKNLTRDDPDAADTLLHAYNMLTENVPGWQESAPNVRGIVSRTAPYKQMEWSDFQALSDAVDNLIEVGRSQKFIEIEGQRVAKEQALDELKAQTATHKDAGLPGVSDKWDRTDRLRRSLWGYAAVTTRVERFVKDMDRGYSGYFRKYFWQPIQESINGYREERKAVMEQIVTLLEPHKERLHGEPIEAGELISTIDGKAYTFEDKAELIGMLAHTGNGFAPGSNGYKLLVGNGWARFDEDGELDTSNFDAFKQRMFAEGIITKEDMDLVQSLWDVAESMKPAVWKAHKKMYGFYPDSVTSVPVMTPFGEYKGGYWPAIVDKTKSRDANMRENRRIAENENNITAFPTSGRGATKSRVDAYAAPLEMSLRLLPSHVDWALRFVHIEPAVKNAAKLLLDKEFSALLERVSPGAVDELLMPWLQRVARQSSDMPVQHRFWRDANSVAAWGRRTTGVLMMAGNTVNIAMQFTGVAPLMYKAGYRNFGRAWLQWMKNPNEMARLVNESSVVMRNATATFIDQDFQRKIRRLIEGQSGVSKLEDWSQDYGYIGQKLVQNLINNVGWIAAYNQAYSGQAKGIEAGDDLAAVRYADTIVSETQGFNNPENISNIEAQTALGRLFLVFYSFFNNQGNFLISEAKMIADKDAPVAAKAASAFHLYLMAYMVPSFMADMIGAALRGNVPDDDDEDGTAMDEWFQFFLISQFKYAAATVPYVGQALNYVISKFTPQKYDDQISVSPVFSTAEKALSAPFSLKRAMFDDGDKSKAVGDIMTAVGLAPGMAAPMGALQRPVKWAADMAEGDSTADDFGDVLQGLSSGRSSKD